MRLLLITLLSSLTLTGCGHKPLKAPCARDERPAQPMAYAALDPQDDAAMKRTCGPMRAINSAAAGESTTVPGWPVK